MSAGAGAELQEVLEAEMTEALGAEKDERASGRQGSFNALGPLSASVLQSGCATLPSFTGRVAVALAGRSGALPDASL
ncbi:MAG: hypothetical protein JO320_10235 [Alphaproteobacteria bacterium]|nr:hypothetical protein [Alphaproteobacteria bacterium]MBV9375418.1 hypothetical protein [Alphaproteobacteria bacterium]